MKIVLSPFSQIKTDLLSKQSFFSFFQRTRAEEREGVTLEFLFLECSNRKPIDNVNSLQHGEENPTIVDGTGHSFGGITA